MGRRTPKRAAGRPLVILVLVLLGIAIAAPGLMPERPAPAAQLIATAAVAERIASWSVTVVTDSGEGSGVLIQHGGKQYALTAAHVIMAEDGTASKQVELVRFLGPTGSMRFEAKLLASSHPDTGHDLALLEVEGAFSLPHGGPVFVPGRPMFGLDVLHVGSYRGQMFPNSFATGSIAGLDRQLGDLPHRFDQVSAPAYPGSSGGGVYDREGRYLGQLQRGGDSTLHFIAPSRRVLAWAAEVGFAHLFNIQ
jgi:S1-C subfamily serine protease